MSIPIPPDVRELLERPNFVHLAYVRADGTPHSVPVWVGLEGERITIGTGYDTLKAKATRKNPAVALSVVDRENPYREANLTGRVVEQRPDEDCAVMDPISIKYTGNPFPMRGPGRVALIIEIDKAQYRELPFTHGPG
jgi:PPOX class probable F420-dependent enzyme